MRFRLACAAGLGETVSGMLVVEDDRGAIGYNATHAPVRQRFTIAHEIAHYILHVKKSRKSQLFIDRSVTFRRDETSSTGDDNQEVEALTCSFLPFSTPSRSNTLPIRKVAPSISHSTPASRWLPVPASCSLPHFCSHLISLAQRPYG